MDILSALLENPIALMLLPLLIGALGAWAYKRASETWRRKGRSKEAQTHERISFYATFWGKGPESQLHFVWLQLWDMYLSIMYFLLIIFITVVMFYSAEIEPLLLIPEAVLLALAWAAELNCYSNLKAQVKGVRRYLEEADANSQ